MPDGGNAGWGALTCWSASRCIAVGWALGDSDSSNSVIAEWNGTAWSMNTPVNEVRGPSYLNYVRWGPSSCTSTLGCLVLGSADRSTLQPPPHLPANPASSWSGTIWTSHPAPNTATHKPAGPITLNGLSCLATTCIAVGYTGSNPPPQTAKTLIERYTNP